MTTFPAATVQAPAKINLGLEIIGKRADGYHEIRTVMAMIDLADTLTVSITGDDPSITIHGVPGVPTGDNLIAKAIEAFSNASGIRAGYEVTVEKQIPSPGGLGGASSDAAATLRALNALHGCPISHAELLRLAAVLGSDVPFFLGTPVALASGTGTDLSPLPAIEGWVVLVVPALELAAKTPTLYGSLRPGDFSDGSMTWRAADAIRSGNLPQPEMLANTFSRALYSLAPELGDIERTMREAGAPHVALSGAGPAHYALVGSELESREIKARLRAALPPQTLVEASRLLTEQPPIEVHPR